MLLSFVDGFLGKFDEWYFHYYCFTNRHSPAMFHGGWGDNATLTAVTSQWRTASFPQQIEIDWEGDWVASHGGVQVRRGSFPTPKHQQYLPLASARAYLHFVRPTLKKQQPVVVLMPTSSEVGVAKRMPLACMLASEGIASLLLESPFMGRRKSAEQHGTTLTYFSDFLLLAAASIEEGRVALGWLGSRGFDQLCCAGISQGGYLATVAGLRSPAPSHVVALLPPHSGVPVLIDGLLGRLCDWDMLQKTSGSNTPVHEQMIELFESTSLELLTPPPAPWRVTIIGARKDRYVPANSYSRMQEVWKNRATVQWLPGGYVSSIAERRHIVRAITQTFAGN